MIDHTNSIQLLNTNNPKGGMQMPMTSNRNLVSNTSIGGMEDNILLTKSSTKMSNSKLKRLSLCRNKSSNQKLGSITSTSGFPPRVKTDSGLNESFALQRNKSSMSSSNNPFLQNNTMNSVQEYSYPTLKRNTSNSSTTSSSSSNTPQQYNYPTLHRHRSAIFAPTAPNTARKNGLKKCISVCTLEESLKSTAKEKQNNSLKQSSRKVSFSNLQIREYDVNLGDNPSCRVGPPISLGWKYSQKQDVSLDKIMDTKRSNKCKPRLDAHTRCELLLNAGYSKSEIVHTVQEIKSHRQQLRRSQSDTSFLCNRNAEYGDSGVLTSDQEYGMSKSATCVNFNKIGPSPLVQNLSFTTTESNALSMKSDQVLNDMGNKLKLLADSKRKIGPSTFVHNQSGIATKSNALSMKSDQVLNDMSSKLNLLAVNKRKFPQLQAMPPPRLPSAQSQSDVLSMKSDQVLGDICNKLKMLKKNKNSQQPFLSLSPNISVNNAFQA